LPLTAALVFSTLGVQLAYNNGVLFDAARALFCATYIVQSVPLLFFTYGNGDEQVVALGPYEAVGGHHIPLDTRRNSLDGVGRKVQFEGDLFVLGLATPELAIALRKRGVPEDRVVSTVSGWPLIVGMGERDFWYRVGVLLGFIERAFPGFIKVFLPKTFPEGPPRSAPLARSRVPAGASRKTPL